ncbi:MAG: multiple sugar transport system permease protein [Candidatus Atribacteria bacterium]|nr:multiple sugar transport system permease protein [Candidatus Atribacteria bacterium]
MKRTSLAAQRRKWGIIFLLPTVVFLSLMIIYPIVHSVLISMQYNRATSPNVYFVGLKNFYRIFTSPSFWQSFRNSIIYAFGGAFAKFLIGFAFALLLNREFRWRGIARGLLLFPWVLPVVAWCATWRWMYSPQLGIINQILLKVGLTGNSLNFLGSRELALPSVMMVGIIEGYPFFMVTLLAALQSVPGVLYEAASIDGASGWQQFVHITIPAIKGVIKISLILGIIWSWNSFAVIWSLTRGGPSGATHLLVTSAYEYAFIRGRYDYGAALSVMTVLFLLILLFIFRRWQKEES